MTKQLIEGKVMIIFKPEIALTDIEKILEGYRFEKVFNNGEFDTPKNKDEELLARFYCLAVGVGTENGTIQQLSERYGPFIEEIYQTPVREIVP